VTDSLITTIIKRKVQQTILEKRTAYILNLKIKKAEKTKVDALHKFIIEKRIKELTQYIGQTPYVFSGSTADGWDCSGLVIWFYEDLGITLPHSATKQGMLKPKIKNPLPGDIVVTKYKNSKNFIHSGIYIGDNKMIHSGFRAGQKTEIINLDDPSFDNQKHYFVRIVGD
jgi:cell wall-associated NlpC family hydrolase